MKLFLEKILNFFNYDKEISESFLAESREGLKYFFSIGVISYSIYSVFDYNIHFYAGMFLRILIVLLCFVPLITQITRQSYERMKYASNTSLFIMFILEIETQMQATDVPFFHTSAWFADLIFIVVHAMYFLGTPIQYSIYWLLLICYYFFRSYIHVSGTIHSEITNVWMYHIETWLFGSAFNLWWFQIRYERKLGEIRLKEEYDKRVFLENELTRRRERDSIFADIHDNLGGKLLDLSIQLNSLQPDSILSAQNKDKIANTINSVLKGLRNHLLEFEDMNKIESNLADGLRFFLLRRYSYAERKINYTIGTGYREIRFPKEVYPHLLNIIAELVNNDLKYGFGVSRWTLNFENNNLLLHLRAQTGWKDENAVLGNGNILIRKRIELLNGSFSESIDSDSYTASVELPVGK